MIARLLVLECSLPLLPVLPWYARSLRRTKCWPAAAGTVIATRRFGIVISEPIGEWLLWHSTANVLEMQYDYTVNRVRHVGDRVAFGSLSNHGIDPGRFLEELMPGAPVQVFYDPAKPAHAVLVPGLSKGLARTYVGLELVLIAAIAYIAWLT